MSDNGTTSNLPSASDFTSVGLSLFNLLNWKKAYKQFFRIGEDIVSGSFKPLGSLVHTSNPSISTCATCPLCEASFVQGEGLAIKETDERGSWTFVQDVKGKDIGTPMNPPIMLHIPTPTDNIQPSRTKHVKFNPLLTDLSMNSPKIPSLITVAPRPILRVRNAKPSKPTASAANKPKTPKSSLKRSRKPSATETRGQGTIGREALLTLRTKRQRKE